MDPTIEGLIHPRTQILATFGGVVLLILIINLVKKEYLKEGYSILWLFTGVVFLITSLFSGVLFWISDTIGIYYAPATLFLLLIIGLLMISIHYSVVLSRHDKKIKELAQENALLKKEIEDKQKR